MRQLRFELAELKEGRSLLSSLALTRLHADNKVPLTIPTLEYSHYDFALVI